MRVYTVHQRHTGGGTDLDPVLVKEGFCWPAFFFGVLWALARGLWFVALTLIALSIALSLLLKIAGVDALTSLAVWFGFALIVGFEGNDWRRRKLARQGFGIAGVIAAPGRDAALRRWFDLNPPGRNEPAAAVAVSGWSPI